MASSRHSSAFTRRELIVVTAVILLFVIMSLPTVRSHTPSERIRCVNNLRQLGVAYRIWSNDHGDFYPAAAPTNGGWRELLLRPDASLYYPTNYAIMANELGQSPAILICPTDERKPASSFSQIFNTNISYFVGVNASDRYPQSLLGGDRNLGPGTVAGPEYGFSPADGHGKDVTITGPVSWTIKMHSRGNSAGCGNILLGDGSVQQVTSDSFRNNWLKSAASVGTTNNSATNPAVRLIFP